MAKDWTSKGTGFNYGFAKFVCGRNFSLSRELGVAKSQHIIQGIGDHLLDFLWNVSDISKRN